MVIDYELNKETLPDDVSCTTCDFHCNFVFPVSSGLSYHLIGQVNSNTWKRFTLITAHNTSNTDRWDRHSHTFTFLCYGVWQCKIEIRAVKLKSDTRNNLHNLRCPFIVILSGNEIICLWNLFFQIQWCDMLQVFLDRKKLIK